MNHAFDEDHILHPYVKQLADPSKWTAVCINDPNKPIPITITSVEPDEADKSITITLGHQPQTKNTL